MKYIFLTLSLILGAKALSADVGDVYYCTAEKVMGYDPTATKVLNYSSNMKFKFRWEADRIVFDDDFIIGNYTMDYVSKVTDSMFSAINRKQYFSDFLRFTEPTFQFVTFMDNPAPIESKMLFASCSKF